MGSIFDNLKPLMGFPADGQQIHFVQPAKRHWFTSVIEDQKLLSVGGLYRVRKTELNSSSSYVWLEDVFRKDGTRPFFNLHSFEWERTPPTQEQLQGVHYVELAEFPDVFGVDVYVNGEIFSEGPMSKKQLWVERNIANRIVSAVYKEKTNENLK